MAWRRTLYDAEETLFGDSVARFLAREMTPHRDRFERQGHIDRALWLKAGEAGLIGSAIPAEAGGAGAGPLYPFIAAERLVGTGVAFFGWVLQDIVAFYILRYGSEAQKTRWLPDLCAGRRIAAIGMTEPGGGSDLKAITTEARRAGDGWILNGSKTFITNGPSCDLAVVAAKTDPAAGSRGVSLFVVEASAPGFRKGAPLEKLGQKAQDTGELFFDDVAVTAANLLGTEGAGFAAMMSDLPFERLIIGVYAIAAGESALDMTVDYARDRKTFGQPLLNHQEPRFTLAELKTELRVGRAFIDACLERYRAGELDAETAAMAKYWATDLQCKVVDTCVQLHGGYGYMWEQPITRAYADARAQRIYGGSNEIMKELIARTL